MSIFDRGRRWRSLGESRAAVTLIFNLRAAMIRLSLTSAALGYLLSTKNLGTRLAVGELMRRRDMISK
jgi:hypothetical protein